VPAAKDAAAQADHCLTDLRKDLEAVRDGDPLRRDLLPQYAFAGDVVVAMRPLSGLEAYRLSDGRLLWSDPDLRGATVGGPQVMGQLVAVGFAKPALVCVLDIGSGRTITRWEAPVRGGRGPDCLLAPPVLDPFGRLFVVTGTATAGRLEILNARKDEPALPLSVEARGPSPAVLHADGRLTVFHDGGEGGANLHFLDMAAGRVAASVETETLLRQIHVLREGERLFVFTHGAGESSLGARLFRVDLASRSATAFQKPPPLPAYAPPILTRRFVAVAGCDASRLRVRLHEKDSAAGTPLARVFPDAGGGGLSAEGSFEAPRDGAVRHDVPPSLAAAGGALAAGSPFGLRRLGAGEQGR
jgi:hypothetical protein